MLKYKRNYFICLIIQFVCDQMKTSANTQEARVLKTSIALLRFYFYLIIIINPLCTKLTFKEEKIFFKLISLFCLKPNITSRKKQAMIE